MKVKFATAGMHGAWRPLDVASAFYESSIPFPIRNLGEDAVLAFVDGKHASHIEAVVNAPGRMMDAANIVWENARDNLARGAADMAPLELAKANALNALHASGIVIAEALQTAAVAGCIGMALEGVISVSENLIYVYKDEMTIQEARRKILGDVLKKGKAAAIGGAGMTVVVALGAGPALATAAPVLVSVGGVLYLVSAYSRIKTALDSTEERPDRHLLEPPRRLWVPADPHTGYRAMVGQRPLSVGRFRCRLRTSTSCTTSSRATSRRPNASSPTKWPRASPRQRGSPSPGLAQGSRDSGLP